MPALLDQVFIPGLIVSFGIMTLWWTARTFTFWIERKAPLTPNCLLTRKPVMLVAPRQPAWKFWSKDQQAVRFLRNHGYDSHLIEVDQLQSVADPSRYHFIASVDFSSKSSLLDEAVRRAEADFI